MRLLIAIGALVLLGTAVVMAYYSQGSHLNVRDYASFFSSAPAVGVLSQDPLARYGLRAEDLQATAPIGPVQYIAKTQYLNHARAVVTHTIDDSSRYIPTCLDAMDKYGIKATVFVSTQAGPIAQLWPRLRQAAHDGHEIGSHSRRHQCKWPDTFPFCFRAYTDYEIDGSRDDILRNTDQPYVWSWCYPCGNCAGFDFVHRKLARAGYLVARNYPGEERDLHNVPDLQTYDGNPYNATYTQVVQKKGGIAKSGRTDVPTVNAKFDEVYGRGGIYNFLSHPQWLDYGADAFYERHLAHIARRQDIWYVPMGPLYAYHTVRESTQIRALAPQQSRARFVVYNNLDPKVFQNSITLEFVAPAVDHIRSNGRQIPERAAGLTDRWNEEYFRREADKLYLTIHPNTQLEFD